MPFPRFASIVLALLIAACSAPGETEHGVTTDPNAAIGFFTENSAVPDTARDIRGDGVLRDADERPYGYALLGQTLPSIEAPLLGGGTLRTADIDEWTVLKVWGIWCGDCRADSPYVAQLAAAIAERPDLDFLSIHTPPSARRADEAFGDYGSVEAYFEAEGYGFPVGLDSDASLRDALLIAWTPSYLLIGPDRTVRGFRTDLSVAGDTAVADFIRDIETVRAETQRAELRTPRIGPDGAMELVRTTPFTRTSLSAAFPGMDLHGGTQMAEGEEYPVFHIAARGDILSNIPLFTIEPSWDRGHVFAVSTTSPQVQGPDGVRIGLTRFGDLDADTRGPCDVGVDAYGNKLICTVAGASGRFAYVFGAPTGFEGYYPEAGDTDRNAGILVEMRYLPPVPTY